MFLKFYTWQLTLRLSNYKRRSNRLFYFLYIELICDIIQYINLQNRQSNGREIKKERRI